MQDKHGNRTYTKLLLTAAATIALTACGGTVVTQPTSVQEANQLASAKPKDYVLGPGDQLDIRFFYNPELDTQVVVRPDGRISAPLVDELQVSGRTVPEINSDLREQYSKELRRPDVSVIVRSFTSHKYFVAGEVETPGSFATPGPLTLMQSIAEAGGLKATARTEEVAVIRRNGVGEPYVVAVNLEQLFSGEDTSQDIYLEPQDIVFVPRSDIAEVNKFIDLYIRQNIPIGVGIGVPLGG